MKTLENRVAELELKLAQALREIARRPVREAMPLAPRHGRWFGVTQASFTKGSDTFVDVEIWIYSTADDAWAASGEIVASKVRDWFLNDGEVIEAGTKVRIDWYESTWVLSNAYCAPSDDPDVIASLGG